jgi:hypothetical protein
MPAKKAKSKAAPSAAAAPPAPTSQPHQALHLANVHKALLTIGNHELFTDIVHAVPLELGAGATEHPYTATDCKVVLSAPSSQEGGVTQFKCGGNFMWIKHVWLANHRVPFNKGQITHLQKTKFPPMDPPSSSPFRTVVALAMPTEELGKGSLARLSPEEIDHSVLFSLEEAIESGADDSILRRWKQLILSWPFAFEVCQEGDPRMWRAQNLREELVDIGESVKLSVRQRVMDVAIFKLEREAETKAILSAEKLAKLYETNMKLARSTEPLSSSFIDSAVTVYRRILCVEENQALLAWCDEFFLGIKKHPLISIYSLQALIDRAQTPEKIAFGLEMLVDHYLMEYIDLGTFSVKKLREVKDSYVNVTNLKLDAKVYLLGPFLDGLDIPPDHTNQECSG